MIIKRTFLLTLLALAPCFLGAQGAASSINQKDLAPLLGGLVQSDRWLIHKDKAQEEFIGNVRYSNDTVSLKADHALSDRLNKIYTLRGNVNASYKLPQNATAQISADKVLYDQKSDRGIITASSQNQAEAIYKTENNTFRAYADEIEFGQKLTSFTLNDWAELEDDNNALYAEQISLDTQSGEAKA
jgi:lipopolysaccharide transport protein LptA